MAVKPTVGRRKGKWIPKLTGYINYGPFHLIERITGHETSLFKTKKKKKINKKPYVIWNDSLLLDFIRGLGEGVELPLNVMELRGSCTC